MYIPEFIAGALTAVLLGMAALITAVIISYNKTKKR